MKTKKQLFQRYILYKMLFMRRKSMLCKQKMQMFLDNNIVIKDSALKRISLDIVGKNNTIVISDSANLKSDIHIFGDNNCVYIDDNVVSAGSLYMLIGQNHHNFGPVHNCEIKIGKNTSFESTSIIVKNSNARVKIGDDCVFAFDIMLYHTDSHPVFDLHSGKIINWVKDMCIGNHVWIGDNDIKEYANRR